ncbi:hypothetical protein A8B73_15025 [Methylosinus sp. 3S-1]|nr:hypothetical protein A8B73_15025 [Methylosinus sp. 3S-1]
MGKLLRGRSVVFAPRCGGAAYSQTTGRPICPPRASAARRKGCGGPDEGAAASRQLARQPRLSAAAARGAK